MVQERVGPRALAAGIWVAFAAMAVLQALAARLRFGDAGWLIPFRQDLALLCMWAAAVPAIIHVVRRHPIRRESVLRTVSWHLLASTLFIVATNIAIRIPGIFLPAATSWPEVARDTLAGLTRFYPIALLVYAAIVLLAQWTQRTSDEETPATRAREKESAPIAPPERVAIREWHRVHLVRPDDIAWIEADDNNVVVHAAGRIYKGRGRISELESQLDPARFPRIHRSAIVHVASIREVQPLSKGDLAVLLHDGKVLRVARSRRDTLRAALGVRV